MAYHTIKTYTTAFGGYSYRVTSDGATVHLQRRAAGTVAFRTFYSMSVEAWEKVADAHGIFDIYGGDNPAILEHIAHT